MSGTTTTARREDQKRKFMMIDEEWMNMPITFPPVLARDLSEEALMVEVEVEGYLSKVDQDTDNGVRILKRTSQASREDRVGCVLWGDVFECRRVEKKQAVEPPKEVGPQEKVSVTEEVLVNLCHPDQLVTIGKNLSPEGSAQLKALLKKNQDIFAWEPSDMMGVPRRIIKHTLKANPSITLARYVPYQDIQPDLGEESRWKLENSKRM
ncbi:hypothetical protein Tco_0133418 [Tanacetum coccineum]